jgi:chitin synthase
MLDDNDSEGGYDYLNRDILALFKQQTGQDITQAMDAILAGLSAHDSAANNACLANRFYYVGQARIING